MDRPSGTEWRYDARDTVTRPELAPVFLEAPVERERIVWEDDGLRASLDRGLSQAAAGHVKRLDI